jgi:hypothetical protein
MQRLEGREIYIVWSWWSVHDCKLAGWQAALYYSTLYIARF